MRDKAAGLRGILAGAGAEPTSPSTDPWDFRPVDLEREDSPIARLAEQIADKIKDWLTRGARSARPRRCRSGRATS